MDIPKIYTIGSSGKDAETFFELLRRYGIQRLIDVRLKNTSQLAGFTKRKDLAYFLRQILNAEYIHDPMLAPTNNLLRDYEKGKIAWEDYAKHFRQLLDQRRPQDNYKPDFFSTPTVLLCSEPKPDHCHRRLVAEYLVETWSQGEVHHL